MSPSSWKRFVDALCGLLRTEAARMTERDLEALGMTSKRDPVTAMPFALGALTHPQPRVRDAAIECVCSLAAAIPPARLPELDRVVREPTWRGASWLDMKLEALHRETWPIPVWALFTMHGNGHVREFAVERLESAAPTELALPYLVLRVSDWVPAVRRRAAARLDSWLDSAPAEVWVGVLGLVASIRDRTRAEHVQFVGRLQGRLGREDAGPAIAKALSSSDRGTRHFVRTSIGSPSALLGVARTRELVSHLDPATRQFAVRDLLDRLDGAARAELVEAARHDPSAMVRRTVLVGELRLASEARSTELQSFLLDRSATIRAAARFYLRDTSEPPFDVSAFYRDRLRSQPTESVVLGVGETGTQTDVEMLQACFDQARSVAVAAAAVSAIAMLDRTARVEWFESLLAEPRARVARAACSALLASGVAFSGARVRRSLHDRRHPHTARLAIRVLLAQGRLDALPDALRGAVHDDPVVVARSTAFLAETLRSVRAREPFPEQAAEFELAWTETASRLPKDLADRVRAWFGD